MQNLLEVRDLSVKFHTVSGIVNALNGVSFDIRQNESIGFVGESGCGKSVTARAILRILEKNSELSGEINLIDESGKTDLVKYKSNDKELRAIRGGRISMIFQEPMSALCPVYTVGNQLAEAIMLHSNRTKRESYELATEYLASVGIARPAEIIKDYPYQLSGGMRQRVTIAMALSCEPDLLIADEPTTALDVTVSAQILKLLEDQKEQRKMSIMMINHNMGIIAQTCDRVFVMYLGRIFESASVEGLFDKPMHPYTKDLLMSIPRLDMKKGSKLAHIKGAVPDPLNIPSGCVYHNRCSKAIHGLCEVSIPDLREVEQGHVVACHHFDDNAAKRKLLYE